MASLSVSAINQTERQSHLAHLKAPGTQRRDSARIIARSLFKELKLNGYDAKQIVSVSSELISLVTTELSQEDTTVAQP